MVGNGVMINCQLLLKLPDANSLRGFTQQHNELQTDRMSRCLKNGRLPVNRRR